MLGRYIIDELHDEDGFADAGATEQPDLAALGVGADEIDDLDAGFQDLGRALLILKRGGGTVDGPAFLGLDRRAVIDGLAQKVENASETFLAHRHADGRTGINSFHAAHQAIGAVHGDAAHHIIADVLSNLGGDDLLPMLNGDGIAQGGQFPFRKADIQYRTDDLRYDAFMLGGHDASLLICYSSAPATISVSSCVMLPCRARLYCRFNLSIISSAFCVAESIAIRRAESSLASDSHNAP